jgi:hypothetical protein
MTISDVMDRYPILRLAHTPRTPERPRGCRLDGTYRGARRNTARYLRRHLKNLPK